MQMQKEKNALCTSMKMNTKKVTLMVQSKFILAHLHSNRRDSDDECDY